MTAGLRPVRGLLDAFGPSLDPQMGGSWSPYDHPDDQIRLGLGLPTVGQEQAQPVDAFAATAGPLAAVAGNWPQAAGSRDDGLQGLLAALLADPGDPRARQLTDFLRMAAPPGLLAALLGMRDGPAGR